MDYSGDETYGDDVTSGIFEDDDFADVDDTHDAIIKIVGTIRSIILPEVVEYE